MNSNTTSEAVSSIVVDGVEYFSDRFYLNRGVGDPPVVPTDGCSCGARAPPPLLDRERLVASLDLKAAIVASYTVAPSHIIREYPSLFGPDSVIPTLILHGHKGLSERMRERSMNRPPMSQDSSRFGQDTKRAPVDMKDEVRDSFKNMNDSSDEDEPSARVKSEYGDEVLVKEEEQEEEPPEDAWLRKQNETILSKKATFGKSVHLTEILPTWVSEESKKEIESLRREAATSKVNDDDDDGDVIVLDSEDEETPVDTRYGVEHFVVQRRKRKQGVHHPKFMILFETSGSVVVLVTSANLTPQHAVDASWMQRFQAPDAKDITDDVTDSMRCDGSDFGCVLANYLECQSLAARAGEMVPEVFLHRYLGFTTLDDFRRRFKWNSQVHLIATVPGEYRGPETVTHLGETGTRKTFLYGSQRVSDILRRLSESSSSTDGTKASQTEPWLPRSFLSKDDRLIMQQTSFGGLWKQASLSHVVRLYCDTGTNCDACVRSQSSTHAWLDRADIVWPSRGFMAEIHGKARKNPRVPSPDSVTSTDMEDELSSDATTDGSFCFLSSESFNSTDFACIARMCMFEPSYPNQNPSNRSPHIKSYARLFEGDEYQLRKNFGVEKAEECLSWVMLTSACLSRGAQGEATPHRASDSDELNYTNFELGVLFVSRLGTTDMKSNRVYCWKPSKCHCGQHRRPSEKPSVQMIHLPLPYRLRPRKYVEDEDEDELCETPYFHEIPRGSLIRHMRLTPLGAKLAATRM